MALENGRGKIGRHSIGPYANLFEADLAGADLTGADLYGADLSLANLSNVDLSNAMLQNADLRGAYLQGADLTGADLHNARLTNANFENATVDGENIELVVNAIQFSADLMIQSLRQAPRRAENPRAPRGKSPTVQILVYKSAIPRHYVIICIWESPRSGTRFRCIDIKQGSAEATGSSDYHGHEISESQFKSITRGKRNLSLEVLSTAERFTAQKFIRWCANQAD